MLLVFGNYDGCDVVCEVFVDWFVFVLVDVQDMNVFQYWIDIGDVCLIVIDMLDVGYFGGCLGVQCLDWLVEVLVCEMQCLIVIVMYYLLFVMGIGYMDV